MLKLIVAAIAFLFGAAHITQKKDRVIVELTRENNRLKSYEHHSSIFRSGFADGYNRGWLDRNMNESYRYPQN